MFIPDHQVYQTNNSGSIPEFSIGKSIFGVLWFCFPNWNASLKSSLMMECQKNEHAFNLGTITIYIG